MVDTLEPVSTKLAEEEFPAMGFKKNETNDVPTPVEEINEKSSGSALFINKDIEGLISEKDNPQYQLAAVVLISNSYQNFNVRNEQCIGWIESVDTKSVFDSLNIEEKSRELISDKQQQISIVFKQFDDVREQVYKFSSQLDRSGYASVGSEIELKEQLDVFREKQRELEAQLNRLYREMMLPVREAILNSETAPEIYKLNVIEGIKGGDSVLQAEDDLLRKAYANTENLDVKRQVANTVAYNIGKDINAFDIVPISDLEELGADIDKLLLATLGNEDATDDFIEQRFAPAFFPEEDPIKIRECWEVLKKVTRGEGNNQAFFSDGLIHNTNLMNREYFGNFVDNSDDLIPIVEMLSSYGFMYSPGESLEDSLYPPYIDDLKTLGKDLDQLRGELEIIKSIIPDYRYEYKVDRKYSPKNKEYELYVKDNPFAIALEEGIYIPSIVSDDKLNEVIGLFDQLYQASTDRWQGGLLQTYIGLMSYLAGRGDRPPALTQKAILEANKYALDPNLTTEQIELFATDYFSSSLDPKNENVKAVMEFCEKHADKILVWVDDERHIDADNTWHKLSLLSADLYRYPFDGNELEALAKLKQDLIYAGEAVQKIEDKSLKDKAALNLIFALTDGEAGDLNSAIQMLNKISDGVNKEEAIEEIRLEIERQKKGETIAWKKIEKINKHSSQNTELLKGIFGFSPDEESSQKAIKEYQRVYDKYPQDKTDSSSEKQVALDEEVKRIEDDFTVTLNITFKNMLKCLEAGRLISIWENPELMELRNNNGKYHYGERRNQVERLVGNRGKGGRKDPHPIYGAASSPNGRDEYYGGTGGGYGECFFVFKKDKIRDRTSFCYDDSFGAYNRWMVNWDGGITTKAIHNLNGINSRHGYVEAQILGGVSLDDIESVNVPEDAINGKNESDWSAGIDVLDQITQLREQYPNIEFNIIKTPK